MKKFKDLMKEQCEAALGIKENYGVKKALGYLIGEKLYTYLKIQKNHQEIGNALLNFIHDIKSSFPQWEIKEYFDTLKRLDIEGHVLEDDQYEFMKKKGVFGKDDPVKAVEDILIVDKMEELLLEY